MLHQAQGQPVSGEVAVQKIEGYLQKIDSVPSLERDSAYLVQLRVVKVT